MNTDSRATSRRSRTGTEFKFSARRQPGCRERGFALIVAIWISALLAVLALALATSNRSRLRAVAGDVAKAEAEAAAEGGIHLALAALVEKRQQGDRGVTGLDPAPCRFSNGLAVQVSITDEAGKVDINIAGEALLRALLIGIGLDPVRAQAAAAAIIDYRDADDERGVEGAERDEYRAAGRPKGPKNASFESTRELAAVLGLSVDEARRLGPYVTVGSEQEGIDPRAAVPGLGVLFARAASEGPILATRNATGFFEAESIPPQWRVASAGRAVAIRSTAVGRRDATAVIEAVVAFAPPRQRTPRSGTPQARAAARLQTSFPAVPVILDWRRVEGDPRQSPPARLDALTPC